MKLSEIQAIIGGERLGPVGDPEITALHEASGDVLPGAMFVAIPGNVTDGHRFISDAVSRGASAVLVSTAPEESTIPCLLVNDTALAARQLAAEFYGHPSRSMRMIGITGTNGKTTTTYMLESIIKSAGRAPGVVGTIDYRYGGKILPAPNTSPDALPLQRLLAAMQNEGVSDVAMEVSSHAIHLNRIAGTTFDVVLFTNLSVEHTDFHPTMEDYFQTKARLFEPDLVKSRHGVINVDDAWGRRLAENCPLPCTTISLEDDSATLVAGDIHSVKGGVHFTVAGQEFAPLNLRIHLAGRFNVMNALGAVAVALHLGIDREFIQQGLDNLAAVPGRFENVGLPGGFPVIVDYAHTPDGLDNLLQSARLECSGKLITVFGCGGDRSREKRPVMGRVVGKYSDWAVLTSDNPRTEDPLQIIADVLPGLKEVTEKFEVEADRRLAIRRAIERAETGDMVVIAGKGHEDYQILGRVKHHFDDREVARECLEEIHRAAH